MRLSDEQRHEFETVTKPVIEWLNKNCHPHVMAIADGTRRLRIHDLRTLDLANSDLVARLFHEYMVGMRSQDEWQSLAELAQRNVFPDEKLVNSLIK